MGIEIDRPSGGFIETAEEAMPDGVLSSRRVAVIPWRLVAVGRRA
jgi:hypothetical protein